MGEGPHAGTAQPARLSVIVPAWNAAATIDATLHSILADPTLPLECLVVDDGSTDTTAAVVDAIAAADPRVRLLRQSSNAGVSAARNRALEVAQGEWLAFVDSDDRLVPGGLRALLKAAEERDPLVVVGQRVSTDGARRWYPPLYDHPDIREPGRKSIVSHPGLLYYAGPAGKLYHRSIAEGLRFSGRMLGDQPWVLQALLRAGDRIEVIAGDVYEWWRPRPGRTWNSITTERIRSVQRGAEAAAMARVAYDEVTAAFGALLTPRQAEALSVGYLDRLVRSELAPQVTSAVRRRDPEIGILVRALAEFVAAIPPAVRAESRAIADALVRPLVLGWWWLPPDARAAFWDLSRHLGGATGTRRAPGTPRMAWRWIRAVASFGWSRLRRRLGLGREELVGLDEVRRRATG